MRRAGVFLSSIALVAALVRCAAFSSAEDDPGSPAADGGVATEAGFVDGPIKISPFPEAGPDGFVDPCLLNGPTQPCFFDSNLCTPIDLKVGEVSDGGHPGVFTLRYLHEPTRSGGFIYFTAQENSLEGRNQKARGYVYRATSELKQPVRLTGVLNSPAAITVSNGWIYWRIQSTPGPQWQVVRLRQAVADLCQGACAPQVEIVATESAIIERIVALSDSEVYYTLGGVQIRRVVREAGSWSTPESPATAPGTIGALSAGPPALWTLKANDGVSSAYVLGGAAKWTPVAKWAGAGPQITASSCRGSFLYNPDQGPFHRIDLNVQELVPLKCTSDCAQTEVYSFSADGMFGYVASPNAGGGIHAVPLAGGSSKKLLSGDVWSVSNDLDAVYFSDVNGGRVGKIPKR